MTCFFCKGNMDTAMTKHFVDRDTCVIIIKSVPCYKCTQCGEVAYTLNVGKRLEEIAGTLLDSLTEIVVANYSENVA